MSKRCGRKSADAVVPNLEDQSALDSVSLDLMERIVDDGNLERAWKKVKANRGAPGPDGVTLDEFFETFRHQWPEVRRQLLDSTYRPGPARRKAIPKPDGSTRNLGIPNVIDLPNLYEDGSGREARVRIGGTLFDSEAETGDQSPEELRMSYGRSRVSRL